MLLSSTSLTSHEILAETNDIAIGDFLDKAARAILPKNRMHTPYGQALEAFAFPPKESRRKDYSYGDYSPPARRQDELETKPTQWEWSLSPPLSESKSGDKSTRRMMYAFSGLLSSVERLVARRKEVQVNSPPASDEAWPQECRDLAREVQRVAFEHLGSRFLFHLD